MHRFLLLTIAASLWLLSSLTHAAHFSDMEQELSDSVITVLITTKFTENKHLNPLKISVTTDHGVVKLSGHVNNKDAFIEALKIALDVNGVQSVDTEELHIQHVNSSFTDAYITAKTEVSILKAKLLDDETIPLVNIHATTTNGVVTLTGKVRQQRSVSSILRRVNEIRGIKKVIAKIQVVQQT